MFTLCTGVQRDVQREHLKDPRCSLRCPLCIDLIPSHTWTHKPGHGPRHDHPAHGDVPRSGA
eukprot:1066191-Prymnesium_polylepis.1